MAKSGDIVSNPELTIRKSNEDLVNYTVSQNVEFSGNPIEINEADDLALSLYRNYQTRDLVVSYFTKLTGSKLIAEKILFYSDKNDVSASLAFSLCWAESAFKVDAVNQNAYSIDRGLFQLNSKSFPTMTLTDFFHPETNIRTGIEYLSYCLEAGGNEITGLAYYNAGRTRVSTKGTPQMTLNYINKIFSFKDQIHRGIEEDLFVSRTVMKQEYASNSIRYVLTDEEGSNRLNVW